MPRQRQHLGHRPGDFAAEIANPHRFNVRYIGVPTAAFLECIASGRDPLEPDRSSRKYPAKLLE